MFLELENVSKENRKCMCVVGGLKFQCFTFQYEQKLSKLGNQQISGVL